MASLSPETLLLQVSLMPRKTFWSDRAAAEWLRFTRLVLFSSYHPLLMHANILNSSLPIYLPFSAFLTRTLKILFWIFYRDSFRSCVLLWFYRKEQNQVLSLCTFSHKQFLNCFSSSIKKFTFTKTKYIKITCKM